MIRLTEIGNTLVLAYPAWTGLVFAAFALGVLVLALRRQSAPIKRVLALPLALIFGWAAVYFPTYRCTFSGESARLYAFLKRDADLRWERAASIALEGRRGYRRTSWHIVVGDDAGRELEFAINDLGGSDRARLAAYVAQHAPSGAFVPDRESWVARVRQLRLP